MFTQSVKNRLVGQAQQQLLEAQSALRFAQNLQVGKATDIARAVRISQKEMNGITMPAQRGHRHLSEASKRRISRMMKKRWAAKRRAEKA